MRRRKASSPAGSPPSAHAGQLKDLLFFGYDPSSKSVAVGPQRFTGAKSPDAPHLLEFGGTVRRTLPNGKSVEATYHGNPFMGPALDAEVDAGTIPPQWKDCLRGS